MPDLFTVTVSQITRRLSLLVGADKQLKDIYVKGEISNFTHHRPSGHIYLTLKDENASIRCVMFRNNAERLSFTAQNGMKVLVKGSVSVYEKDGTNQIYITEMLEDGLGDEYIRFMLAKQQLEKEGYFAKKRELPSFPKKICIITSEKAAALQDMLNIIGRRCPVTKILLINATVQGELAPKSLINALQKAQDTDVDLIIIGRGGGSAEDLSAFNDVELAKCLFESRIPTISAVGHETDFSITDFVADLRAPTPSAAAELAVPDCSELFEQLEHLRLRLKNLSVAKIISTEEIVKRFSEHILSLTPKKKLNALSDNLESVSVRINDSARRNINTNEMKLEALMLHISDLSPMNVLGRGYSITQLNKKVVKSKAEIKDGDLLEIIFSDGSIEAVAKK